VSALANAKNKGGRTRALRALEPALAPAFGFAAALVVADFLEAVFALEAAEVPVAAFK
jgi:hypothetical protein